MPGGLLRSLVAEMWKSAAALTAAVGGWTARLIKEWHYRADIHKLHGMSDRQLRDIGLPRSRIEEAVRGGAQREAPTGRLRSLFHP